VQSGDSGLRLAGSNAMQMPRPVAYSPTHSQTARRKSTWTILFRRLEPRCTERGIRGT